MSRIFRYVLATDNGMAPCSAGGTLTLATCKPVIRRSAQPGDWVMGFYPGTAQRGLLAWAGRVIRSVDVGDYEREFRGRPDAIYRRTRGGGFRRLVPSYHPTVEQFYKDTTQPVLVFDPAATWYFGNRPQMLPKELMHLAAGGQGHRVNGRVEGDLDVMVDWLRRLAAPGVHGQPRDVQPSYVSSRRC